MTHACELSTSDTISALRAKALDGPALNNEELSQQIYLSWDSASGSVSATAHSEGGYLLNLKGEVAGSPEWFSLNIGLGQGQFQPGEILGILFELKCSNPLLVVPFIRTSMGEGEYSDTYLPDDFTVYGTREIITLLHTIIPADALCNEGFHTLVLPLPSANFDLQIYDMRLFVIEAGRHVQTRLPQVSDLG